jgi:hypothetical protein
MAYIQAPGHFPYRRAQVILPDFPELLAIFDPNEFSLSQLRVSELDLTKQGARIMTNMILPKT